MPACLRNNIFIGSIGNILPELQKTAHIVACFGNCPPEPLLSPSVSRTGYSLFTHPLDVVCRYKHLDGLLENDKWKKNLVN